MLILPARTRSYFLAEASIKGGSRSCNILSFSLRSPSACANTHTHISTVMRIVQQQSHSLTPTQGLQSPLTQPRLKHLNIPPPRPTLPPPLTILAIMPQPLTPPTRRRAAIAPQLSLPAHVAGVVFEAVGHVARECTSGWFAEGRRGAGRCVEL